MRGNHIALEEGTIRQEVLHLICLMHNMKQTDNVTMCQLNGCSVAVYCLVLCFQPLMKHSKQGRVMFMSNADMLWKNTNTIKNKGK